MNRSSMIVRNCLIAFLASFAFFLACDVRLLGQTAAATNAPPQDGSVEQTIHDYILSHPEVLIESLRLAKQREDDRIAATRRSMIGSFRMALFEDPNAPFFGNPTGDATLVEFFDYRCPYCRKVEPLLQALIKEDPGVRIVQKQFPILGPASVFAARVALAAQKQGKHAKLHEALMTRKPNIDEATILKIAEEVGLDLDRIKVDMTSREVDAEIEVTAEIAKALRLNGTPAFVTRTEVVPGGTDLATLKSMMDDARRHRDIN